MQREQTQVPTRLLTPAQVAEILVVAPSGVRRMLETGELRGLRVGDRWRVSPSALAEFMREHEDGRR